MVSVVIPNFNHAKFLKQRIDSVLSQTYDDFEVIILDDCSTDNSRVVIEGYSGHPRISHIVFNSANSGSVFKQWRKGIELAKGDWVWIAESDDWCEPVFLETLMAGVTERSILAFCQSVVVSDQDKILWSSKGSFLSELKDGRRFIEERMLKENSIFNASMCIFRRRGFANLSEEFATYKFCGDWLFWIEMLLQGDIFISGKVLNYFRKHGADVSGDAYRTGVYYQEYFRLLDQLERLRVLDSRGSTALLDEKLMSFLKDRILLPLSKAAVKKEFRKRMGTRYYQGLRKFITLRLKQKGRAVLDAF